MENEKVSIIVPIYNMQDYLEKSVGSLLEQTYKNLEIILVDDGSTDNSGKMCDEFAKKDSRVKVLHKTNGGLSSARNAALDIFTGEYIASVDPDDYVFPTYVEKMYNALKQKNAKICFCGHYENRGNGEVFLHDDGDYPIEEINPYKYDLGGKEGHTQYWCYMYHKSLAYDLAGEKIYFKLNHVRMEDVPYWVRAMSSLTKEDKILKLKNKLYVYKWENKPIMNMQKILSTYEDNWEVVKEGCFDKKNLFRSLIPVYAVNYCSFLATFIIQGARKSEQFKKAKKIVRKHYFRLMFSKAKLKIKVKLTGLLIFSRLYEKWYKKRRSL